MAGHAHHENKHLSNMPRIVFWVTGILFLIIAAIQPEVTDASAWYAWAGLGFGFGSLLLGFIAAPSITDRGLKDAIHGALATLLSVLVGVVLHLASGDGLEVGNESTVLGQISFVVVTCGMLLFSWMLVFTVMLYLNSRSAGPDVRGSLPRGGSVT